MGCGSDMSVPAVREEMLRLTSCAALGDRLPLVASSTRVAPRLNGFRMILDEFQMLFQEFTMLFVVFCWSFTGVLGIFYGVFLHFGTSSP